MKTNISAVVLGVFFFAGMTIAGTMLPVAAQTMNTARQSSARNHLFGGAPKDPVSASCSVDSEKVWPGEPVKATVSPHDFSPKHALNYQWATNGGRIEGSGESVIINTTGVADGTTYNASVHVTDPKDKKAVASCLVSFATMTYTEIAAKRNALILQVNNAMKAGNWQDVVDPLQQLTTIDPTNWQFYSGLGNAQLRLGQFDQAIAAYEKGIQAAENNTAVNASDPSSDPAKKRAGVANMLANQGNAYLKVHKNDEAIAAFAKAAAMDPDPGMAYFNLCVTQYNTGKVEGALDACDKAIAANPSKADTYFIKGSLLMAGSKTDKNGNLVGAPGCVEALKKYLELAPEGAHANDVKQMLEAIGASGPAKGR